MEKNTVNDLKLLVKLTTFLNIDNNIPIVLGEKKDYGNFKYISFVAENNGEIILDCHYKDDKNFIYGTYKDCLSKGTINYNIKGLCPNIYMLTEINTTGGYSVKFLSANNYGSLNIIEFLKRDFQVIDSSYIANMQILTIDEEQEGKVLVKQMENKNS